MTTFISDEISLSLMNVVMVGPFNVIRKAVDNYATTFELKRFTERKNTQNDPFKNEPTTLFYDDFNQLTFEGDFYAATSSAAAGRASCQGVELATKAVIDGCYDAIVTAPISKESVNLAGKSFQGHTEFIAAICDSENFCMMQSDGGLRVAFVTCHIPLMQVHQNLNQEKILNTIILLNEAARADGVDKPQIAIAGVNPHAGEGGYMGREELDIVVPAMRQAKKLGLSVHGPLPADTLFIESVRGQYDGIVSMYHDQGHIPFKMLAFDRGVNSTLGLPIIRTSVDHGTAFDIAWQGRADTGSLKAALMTAYKRVLSKNG